MKPKIIAALVVLLAPFAAFAQQHRGNVQSGGGYHGGASHVGGDFRRGNSGGHMSSGSHSGWRPPVLRPIAGRPYYGGRHYYGGYYGRPYYYGYPRYSYYYGPRYYGYGYGGYGGFYAGLAIGSFVASLPYVYDTFWYGGVPYYYYENTYYRWNRGVGQYEVVERPSNTAPAEERAAPKDLYVYPTKGQSEEQQKTDRYECHRWAVDKTNFDPTAGLPAQEGDNEAYRRAETACLTGRGYSVK